MASREEMLDRIRQALGRKLAPPATSARPPWEGLPPARLENVLPSVEPSQLLERFEEELRKVAGQTHRVSSRAELDSLLRDIILHASPASAVLSRNPLFERLKLCESLRRDGVTSSAWHPDVKDSEAQFREDCFTAGVGVTGVDFALAETGSLVLTSHTEGSQLASLAPPQHVALYTRAQIVPSLDDVLERLPRLAGGEGLDGRSVVLVTGTSRTADIEQILIRGVHGPRELHAVLVEESCFANEGAPAGA